MKKLFYLLSVLFLTSCVEAPSKYSDRVIRTGDYAVEVSMIILLFLVFTTLIVLWVKFTNIKDELTKFRTEMYPTNKILPKQALFRYNLDKDLYGQEIAKENFIKVIIAEYQKKITGYTTNKDVQELQEKIQKKYADILQDAGIELPKLEMYTNYWANYFAKFQPGKKFTTKYDAYEYVIKKVNPEKMEVVEESGVIYNIDNILLVEKD